MTYNWTIEEAEAWIDALEEAGRDAYELLLSWPSNQISKRLPGGREWVESTTAGANGRFVDALRAAIANRKKDTLPQAIIATTQIEWTTPDNSILAQYSSIGGRVRFHSDPSVEELQRIAADLRTSPARYGV